MHDATQIERLPRREGNIERVAVQIVWRRGDNAVAHVHERIVGKSHIAQTAPGRVGLVVTADERAAIEAEVLIVRAVNAVDVERRAALDHNRYAVSAKRPRVVFLVERIIGVVLVGVVQLQRTCGHYVATGVGEIVHLRHEYARAFLDEPEIAGERYAIVGERGACRNGDVQLAGVRRVGRGVRDRQRDRRIAVRRVHVELVSAQVDGGRCVNAREEVAEAAHVHVVRERYAAELHFLPRHVGGGGDVRSKRAVDLHLGGYARHAVRHVVAVGVDARPVRGVGDVVIPRESGPDGPDDKRRIRGDVVEHAVLNYAYLAAIDVVAHERERHPFRHRAPGDEMLVRLKRTRADVDRDVARGRIVRQRADRRARLHRIGKRRKVDRGALVQNRAVEEVGDRLERAQNMDGRAAAAANANMTRNVVRYCDVGVEGHAGLDVKRACFRCSCSVMEI